jgi:hypothetical protein
METQQYTSLLLLLPTRSLQQYKDLRYCHGKQQWISVAQLSRYKIFPVNDAGVLMSECEVPDFKHVWNFLTDFRESPQYHISGTGLM